MMSIKNMLKTVGLVALSTANIAAALSSGSATASHILVKDEAKCEELKQQILAAADQSAEFAEVAKKESTCPSGKEGGSLGQFGQGQMVPEFDAVIFDPETVLDNVYGPVKTQFGFHLIIVKERTLPKPTSSAEASHILVDAEEKCEELKKQILEKGSPEEQAAEFKKVAEADSKCPSGKQSGGNLGEFKKGQMVPEFENVIFADDTDVGKVYGPVKTDFGHHLLLVHKRTIVPEEAAEELSAEEKARKSEF